MRVLYLRLIKRDKFCVIASDDGIDMPNADVIRVEFSDTKLVNFSPINDCILHFSDGSIGEYVIDIEAHFDLRTVHKLDVPFMFRTKI